MLGRAASFQGGPCAAQAACRDELDQKHMAAACRSFAPAGQEIRTTSHRPQPEALPTSNISIERSGGHYHGLSTPQPADILPSLYQPPSFFGWSDQRYSTIRLTSSSVRMFFQEGMYRGGAGLAESASGGILPLRMMLVASALV